MSTKLRPLNSLIVPSKTGATVLVFGCAPMKKAMKICPEEIFAKELTILGTKINPYTFPESVALVKIITCFHDSCIYEFLSLNCLCFLFFTGQKFSIAIKNADLQVNLCQKHLFSHQLIHNITKVCSLIYQFNT